jgi:hypothetical protein
MNEPERFAFLQHLARTRDDFQQAAAGLSAAQAQFKPTPKCWSVEEIVEHVAIAEHGMYRFITEMHQLSDDPHEAESTANLARASDRKHLPLMAPERAHPKGKLGSLPAAMNQFLENLERTIAFVRNCQDDLRFRLIQHPLGILNGKDCLTVLTYHPARHIQQMDELKASPRFPR